MTVRGFAALRLLPQQLRRDRRGVSTIEFALVVPVFIGLLLGIYDLGYQAYLSAVLHGAVQQVARDDALETADTPKADAYVEDLVLTVAPGAKVIPKRVSYYDFADIRRPEPWDDNNRNGVCDNSEGYTDQNRNGRWDADVGTIDNNGGGNDVVLYTVTVTYMPIFVNPFASAASNARTISASAVKRNQPYALQESYGSVAATCS